METALEIRQEQPAAAHPNAPPSYIRAATQPVASDTKGRLDRRRLARLVDYIETNLEGDLSLDRLASVACLSRFHFSRAFKQAVGQSPRRYVSARRLERAKALLIQDDRPLIDIALALGFCSQANFTRAFQRLTGVAPGQYRRAAGSTQYDLMLAAIWRALPMLA